MRASSVAKFVAKGVPAKKPPGEALTRDLAMKHKRLSRFTESDVLSRNLARECHLLSSTLLYKLPTPLSREKPRCEGGCMFHYSSHPERVNPVRGFRLEQKHASIGAPDGIHVMIPVPKAWLLHHETLTGRASMCASQSIRMSDQCRTHIAVVLRDIGAGRQSAAFATERNKPAQYVSFASLMLSCGLLQSAFYRGRSTLCCQVGLSHHGCRGLNEDVLSSHAG